MIALSTYLNRLRSMTFDMGDLEEEEFLGDGSRRDFFLLFNNVDVGSETVYLDDDTTTDYTLDGTTGRLRLGTAPADGVVIRIIYVSYIVDETTLIEYFETAIELSNPMIGTSFLITGIAPASYVSAEPTALQKHLWFLIFLRELKRDGIWQKIEEAVSWRTQDISVSKTSQIQSAQVAKVNLDKEIKDFVFRINKQNITGKILSGGYEPLPAGSVGGEVLDFMPNLYIIDERNHE